MGGGPKSHRHALMPDLLIVALVPPLLIVSTLLLAHVERRVTASRRLPAPPSPSAALACPAEAQLDGNGVSRAPSGAHAKPDQIEATAGPPPGCREAGTTATARRPCRLSPSGDTFRIPSGHLRERLTDGGAPPTQLLQLAE
jgi:hypothetical protein